MPVFLAYGFRVFFALAALYAAVDPRCARWRGVYLSVTLAAVQRKGRPGL